MSGAPERGGGTVRRPPGVLRCVHRDGTTTPAESAESAVDATGNPSSDRTDPAPRVSRPLKAVSRVLLALYLLALGWLTLRPVPVSWTYPANLTPLASVDRALADGGHAVVRQLAAGLLPLVPFGALLPLVGGRLRTPWLPSLLRTLGCSALLATGCEILGGWSPGHVLNVDDILLGTLGAALGHLTLAPAVRGLLQLSRPRVRRERGETRPYALAAARPQL
ncbi:VanZ family protein [Kitasatospora camelliae]|uniref:VanZ family protein n=1 Tax=Kitasatospora camelliae TaxID=3156397 RepID=A0AAU8JUI7_9ACTN